MELKHIIFLVISGCIASIFYSLTRYIKKKNAREKALDRKHKQDIKWAENEARRRSYL